MFGSGLRVRPPEEEARGGGLSGHHDHQPGHAQGRQGRLSASQENVMQNISLHMIWHAKHYRRVYIATI